MSIVDPFNSLGGFSVGIPSKLVIDDKGNVVNNLNAPNANVTANRIFANSYLYANGQPLSIGASGNNTQVQYNNNGLLAASSSFTFNSNSNTLSITNLQVSNRANLGTIANVSILGGINGYFLQTDGSGNLTWAPAGNGGNTGNGVPGGANTQVQFNDAGMFGGDAGFVYDKASNTLTVGYAVNTVQLAATDATIYNNLAVTNIITGTISGEGSNLTNVHAITSDVAFSVDGSNVIGQVLFANVANNISGSNVSGAVSFANVANNIAGANITGQVANALVAGTVYSPSQPNIVSLGNLLSLTVLGNTVLGNQVLSNYFIGNLFGNANSARNVTQPAQPNITSVGSLTTLTVIGNTTLGNSVVANNFVGNLLGVANSATIANTANVATLANLATLANAANIAGTVTNNSQPNVTSLGTLTGLSVNGITNLGNVANVKITGGTNGYVISTDGLGNLSWVAQSNGGGNASPSGSNTQLQYNDSGTFGASPNLTWNNTSRQLFVGGQSNFNGNVTASIFRSNIANGSAPFIVNSSTPVANLSVETADTVRNSIQSNITSVGTLSNLNVSGNILAGNISANTFTGRLTTSNQPNITSLGLLANINIAGPANLGNISNIKILGGINGYVLSTDGSGNLSWIETTGGNANAAGINTQVQFNSNGLFAGSNNFTYNDTSRFLFVNGNITAGNRLVANFFQSNVLFTSVANVTGNLNAGNVNAGNMVSANFISGTLTTNSQLNINYLGNVGWINVNTLVPNSNGNITFNGSMSGIGAASNITITGNLNAGNYVEADYLYGIVGMQNQPLITSLGNLTSLRVIGTSDLGNVGNVKIYGGNANYVLSTDGLGNLHWQESSGSGNVTPGGANTQLQFNKNGVFAGSSNLTFNDSTNYLFVGGNANANGIITARAFVSNVANGSPPIQVISTTPVANLGVQTAGTVRDNAQPNITSVGNLNSLSVLGNLSTSNLQVTGTFSTGNITATGTIGTGNLSVTGNATFARNTTVTGSGNLIVLGNLNANTSPNVILGNIANIRISGGLNGYVLSTDGTGNLSWSAAGGAGNGNPGGTNTQIQYNNAGIFGGSPFFTFNQFTNNVTVAGNLIANSFTMGAGTFNFSRSNVFFATTNSTDEQLLLAIDANDIAAVDYVIISTDNSIRNFIKISAVISDSTVNYVEYNTVPVNGYTGDFTVSYDSGNVLSPPSIQLKVAPQTANLMKHKMMVTTYRE